MDFEALGLNDLIVPPVDATYRGFPLPVPAIDDQGSEICKMCRGSLGHGANVRRTPATVEMHVVHHGGFSVPEMEDVPLDDKPVFRDAVPLEKDDVEYIEMAPLPLPCGSGGAYAKPMKKLYPIPERIDSD